MNVPGNPPLEAKSATAGGRGAVQMMIGMSLVLALVVAACGDDDSATDPESLWTCEGVADAVLELIQDKFDLIDNIDNASPEEMGAIWETGQEAGEALEVLATELGCDMQEMNDLITEGADRLSADSELGRLIVEGIRAGEESFFEG